MPFLNPKLSLNFVTKSIKFLTYSNSWIGFGAVALTAQFFLIYGLPIHYPLLVFAFFATVLTYTFQRYVKIMSSTRTQGDRIRWMMENPRLVRSIMICGTAGTVYPLFHINPRALIVLFFIGAISLFYAVKIPGKWGKNLRDIPSLKIFLIGIVWAATGTWLPYFSLADSTLELPGMLFLAEFLFIIALTIPFDIRDIELDEDEKKTIPQLMGEKWAIGISILLLVVYYFLLTDFQITFKPCTAFFMLLAAILVLRSNANRKDLYYSFVIDGLVILQPLCLFADYYLETMI